MEKTKIVYAEERISIDDGENLNESKEMESEEIHAGTTSIPHPPSSLTNVNVPDIKSEPIQLTPSLSPLEPPEANVSRTSSIDNIEKFFGQLAKKKNGGEKPDLFSDQENISTVLDTEITETTSASSVVTTTTPEAVPENIENFFGQLADASGSSKEGNSGSGSNSRNDIGISKDFLSNTKTPPDNDKTGTPTNSAIIVDIKTEINDDDHGLDNKTEINLGVTKQNISKTPESDITIIVDTEGEIANKSYQHQTPEIIDNLSLNLTDQNQASPESDIYVGKLEKPGEKSDLEEEKEEIITTIKELSEETTAFTIVDKTQETGSPSVAPAGNTDVSEKTEDNNDEPTTTRPEEITTRRLPSRYVNSKTRSRPKVTTKPPAKVINHNMNLQTALIINTLSKVRGSITVYR